MEQLTTRQWLVAMGVGFGWGVVVLIAGTVAGHTLHPGQSLKITLSALVFMATIGVIYAGRQLVRRLATDT